MRHFLEIDCMPSIFSKTANAYLFYYCRYYFINCIALDFESLIRCIFFSVEFIFSNREQSNVNCRL